VSHGGLAAGLLGGGHRRRSPQAPALSCATPSASAPATLLALPVPLLLPLPLPSVVATAAFASRCRCYCCCSCRCRCCLVLSFFVMDVAWAKVFVRVSGMCRLQRAEGHNG
jgi:hypothetical protein